MKIIVTSRHTIIGTEYTATYGQITRIAIGRKGDDLPYAVQRLVRDMDWLSGNWIVGKSVEVSYED